MRANVKKEDNQWINVYASKKTLHDSGYAQVSRCFQNDQWLYLFALGSDWFVEFPGRYSRNIWVSLSRRWGFETLALFRTTKIHTLFRTTPYLNFVTLFSSDKGQNARQSKFTLLSLLLYTWGTNTTSSSKSNRLCRQYPFDRLTRNYIHCLAQTRTKLYTLREVHRTERSKTRPCPAGHPCLGHMREYPPLPRGWIGSLLRSRSGRSHPMLPALTKLNSIVIGSYFKVKPDKRTTKNMQVVFATLLQNELNSDIARCCAIEWCAYTTKTPCSRHAPLRTLFVTQIQFSQMGKHHV